MTFGDWYDTASTSLGLAERVELGLSRIIAGGFFILLQFVGLGPVLAYALAASGFRPTAPDLMVVVAGALLLAFTWTGWILYRRHWARAWELRRAWSYAIYDPAVLALPATAVGPGEQRDIDTDPEATHPYRARELFPIEDRPFEPEVILLVGGFYGHTDRVRGREAARSWLLAVVSLVVLAGVTVAPFLWGRGPTWADVALLAVVLAVLPPLVSAWGRQVRRLRLAYELLALERADRQRWIGWRMLRNPVEQSAGSAPEERWAESQRLRYQVRRRKRGHEPGGLPVRVLPVPAPASGHTTVAPGSWTLELFDGGRGRLTPADSAAGALDMRLDGLISDAALLAHPLTRGGTHWLVLSDDSHIPVDCRDFPGLHDAAEAVGLQVVRPA